MAEPGAAVTDRRLIPATFRGLPAQTTLITVILGIFGVGLIAQSDRWARTPAYGLLLQITTADTWGVVYLAVAVIMAVTVTVWRWRTARIVAHTLTIALLAMWEFAFVVRYLTDNATTIVNVVSWGTYLSLAVWSTLLIDRPVAR